MQNNTAQILHADIGEPRLLTYTVVAVEILIHSLHTKGLIREWLNTFCTHEYMNGSHIFLSYILRPSPPFAAVLSVVHCNASR